jgi:hypothetical protein
MKKLLSIILTLLFIGLMLNGCKKTVNFTTGINSKVYYGDGDCMPVVVESSRKYSNYSGKVFIVNKRDYDNLVVLNANCNCLSNKIDSLKNKSISTNIKDGKLIQELQPDSFLVMIAPQYYYCYDNVIHVKANTVENKNFYFFHCNSY